MEYRKKSKDKVIVKKRGKTDGRERPSLSKTRYGVKWPV